MFIRINTLRINCDAVSSYMLCEDTRPIIIIRYFDGSFEEIRSNTHDIKRKNDEEVLKILKKLDELFNIKEDIA